ncbi:hypothetical protein MP387_06640 [Streptococcus oralis]|jgi:putative uncharacterized protein (fragment)|uniref:hypothetical protein n=1 Tax=Streptococcus TaxID=1301 RepID=UPI001F4E299A|nr:MULTISPECIES: hypothetical protein [Streptococcus]MDO6345481.1 hypothetical protein [Streptococcus sp. GP0011]UNV67075.1 hypothetical protein MP387_06640 [Streptococcus oralis]
MDILFDKLLVVSSFCLRKIGNLVGFIIGVVIHPIKNIAIWITLLLSSFLIVGNVSIQLEGKDMFLMSVGLVSIMIFISSFLERQTVDIDNKDNFYLGYNIKKIKFHDNFWLRRFNELPVTLLFWLIASFPIIVICSQLKFNFEILNNVFKSVNEIIEYIKVIWLSAFVVISTYCTALLIESVALSSKTFSQSYLYKTTNLYEELKIRAEIEQSFKNLFNNIFSFKTIVRPMVGLEDDLQFKIERVIDYIINRGTDVSSNEEELHKFYNLAFHCESEKIDALIKRIKKYYETEENKKIRYIVHAILLKRNLDIIYWYYIHKWSILNRLKVMPTEIVNLAIIDLWKLHDIENNFYDSEDYQDIFWQICNEDINGFRLPFGIHKSNQDDLKRNYCIYRIYLVMIERVKDINFLNQLKNPKDMMDLLNVLNEIDKKGKNSTYFSDIFSILFSWTIDSKDKDNNFIDLFSKMMSDEHMPVYLMNKRVNHSKNILLNGGYSQDLFDDNAIDYLLMFMKLEDIIFVLIFCLAHSERSHKEVMKIEEFKIWKKSIHRQYMKENIEDLRESEFLCKLCENLMVSQFISKKFIKWMWESIFKPFDENLYEEFMKLGEDGTRSNFSLDRYFVVRLLLCSYDNRSASLYDFKEDNKHKIEKELSSIKVILENENIYLF